MELLTISLDAIDVFCVQLTRNLFAIAKFFVEIIHVVYLVCDAHCDNKLNYCTMFSYTTCTVMFNTEQTILLLLRSSTWPSPSSLLFLFSEILTYHLDMYV